MEKTRAQKLRFAALVSLCAKPGFSAGCCQEERTDGRGWDWLVQVHANPNISAEDERWFLATYPNGCIVSISPAEWQDAVLAALTELAAGEDAALAASEPAAAWQSDIAEHLTPAHDPRDGIDRIEGQRVPVRIGKDVVPVSVAEARAMGDACFPVGV